MRFLIFLIVSVSFLIYRGIAMHQSYPEDDVLDIAFPSTNNIESYDPARIHFDHEYVLLESIYSPLIELANTNSEPFAAVARMFYWRDQKFYLVIRDDLKTVDGHPINVEDVMLSFKRLMILSQNTHGDFKSLVCPETELKSVFDDCPRMEIEGNTLILTPRYRSDLLVGMLSSIDFAIIPRKSFDPVSLKITDYRNTSGPYYVDQDNGDGSIVLKLNPAHFHFEKTMAREVHLVSTKGMNRESVVSLFNQGKVDHITTIEGIEIEDLKKIDLNKSSFHETIHVKVAFAFITAKGKKKIPLKRRLSFAKALQKGFHEYCAKYEGCRPTQQFFLPLSGGDFSTEEEIIFQKAMDSVEMENSGKGIEVGIFNSKAKEKIMQEYIETAKKYLPALKAERAKGIPNFNQLEDSDVPDYIIGITDSGFLEDVSLLSYSMNTGIFGYSQEEGKAWLKDYMQTEDKLERVNKLRTMHLKSLTEGWMIPLYRTPYVAIARKPWKMHLSQLFANNPFWKIRRE